MDIRICCWPGPADIKRDSFLDSGTSIRLLFRENNPDAWIYSASVLPHNLLHGMFPEKTGNIELKEPVTSSTFARLPKMRAEITNSPWTSVSGCFWICEFLGCATWC